MLLDMESNLDIDNACCVDEAFKKLSTIKYDIVVSDYEMPQKNGLEFLKELRKKNDKTPFILFTGKGREVAIQALNLGVDGYFNKQGSPETVYGELCHGIIQTVKRSRAEKAQEKALFFSVIVEDSDDAIIGKTLNGSITSWNKSAERIYGYSEAEALGKSIQILAPSEEKEEITQILKQIGAGQPIKHYQTKRVRKDGVIIDVSLSISPIKNEEGTIIGASTIAREITGYKKVEELAVARLERYQSFIDVTGELGWTTNAAGEVLEDIPSFRNFTGQTYDEVRGWGWSKAVHPDDASAAKLAWQTAVAKKTRYEVEYRLRRFDGVYRSFMARGTPIFSDGEIFEWVGTCIDITERKEAELVVFEAREYAQNILATMRESLLVLDDNLKVISANDSFYRTFEATPKETEGNCIYDLGNSQWNIPKLHELLEKIIPTQSFFANFEVEHDFPKIGHRTMLVNAKQIHQRVKGANLILVAFEDITERKKAEEALRIVAENLTRSNSELEQFAYVASHDLQEPLRMVTSYTQLLAQRYKGKLDADADEFIGYAVDGANRMRRLIDDILSYSRVNRRGNPFRPIESQLALDVALKNLQISIEEKGAVVTHDQLPEVMADEGQLVQLLQNLIGNAIKFRSKEPPRVHVSAKHPKETEYLFSVQDNGIGVDPQYFDRLFKIFQRLHTKEEYPGTGIGLALCKRIVERHGGRIWLESQPGKGTTIFFTLNNKKGEKQEI
jgi:PAS domain S-box-containing protein